MCLYVCISVCVCVCVCVCVIVCLREPMVDDVETATVASLVVAFARERRGHPQVILVCVYVVCVCLCE